MTLFEAHEAHVLKSEAQSEAQSVAQSEVQTGTKTMKETYNMLYTSEMMIAFLRKNLCITLRHMWYTFRSEVQSEAQREAHLLKVDDIRSRRTTDHTQLIRK